MGRRKYWNNTIGERAKQVRNALGLTQIEFVEKLHKLGLTSSQSVISSIEKNNRKPDLEYLIILAKEFDVDLNWFVAGYTDEEKMTRNLENMFSEIHVDYMLEHMSANKKKLCIELIKELYKGNSKTI